MVLLDDNFATIVAAVEEGRVIYDNIRKYIKYSIAGNIGKILVVLTGPLVGMPLTLLPLQLLWLNLLTDALLAAAGFLLTAWVLKPFCEEERARLNRLLRRRLFVW